MNVVLIGGDGAGRQCPVNNQIVTRRHLYTPTIMCYSVKNTLSMNMLEVVHAIQQWADGETDGPFNPKRLTFEKFFGSPHSKTYSSVVMTPFHPEPKLRLIEFGTAGIYHCAICYQDNTDRWIVTCIVPDMKKNKGKPCSDEMLIHCLTRTRILKT